jgi:hypothetical protein
MYLGRYQKIKSSRDESFKKYGRENQKKQRKKQKNERKFMVKYPGKQANNNRIRWYGHILRKNEERIPKKKKKKV